VKQEKNIKSLGGEKERGKMANDGPCRATQSNGVIGPGYSEGNYVCQHCGKMQTAVAGTSGDRAIKNTTAGVWRPVVRKTVFFWS